MGDRTAFFYGTLMASEILHRVIFLHHTTKTHLTITPALLKDFCRHRVRFADYPGIIKEEGHTVKGTYVTGLTERDIYYLDAFEGGEYERQWVEVEVLGEVKRTETYVYIAGEACLEKMEWDYEEFRREKLERWTGLESREFDEVDAAAGASEKKDDDGDRGEDGKDVGPRDIE